MNEYPEISLDLNGAEFVADPSNATLYTFLGQTALPTGEIIENASRNHVFLDHQDPYINDAGDEVRRGAYIFGEAAQRVGAVMLDMGFPANLNRWAVPACDEDSYQAYIAQQESADEIDDYIPEDFYE